jgi:hemerythrin
MEESFRWDSEFETGLADIDDQHHHLVELINQFSTMVMDHRVDETNVVMLFAELTDYTHYHFRDEEALMEKAGLHPDYIADHKKIHEGFINQLELLKHHSRPGLPKDWESLLEFLYAWLVFHILGHDKDIARQLGLIKTGKTPAQAMQEVTGKSRLGQVEPLMRALNNMVDMLTARNIQLDDLNRLLEDKVLERTQEIEAANRKLEALSLTDVLTGLPNRRHAMQQLQSLWEETEARGLPLSCLMIDADYFKEVNDSHGHEGGDKVLKLLARTLRENIRTDDFVARLGGDEFLVICPETRQAGAQALAHFLLDKVKQIVLKFPEGRVWRSSISIGVAEKTSSVADVAGLLKAADDNLYLAKAAGRGCVRMSGDPVK